MSVLRPAPSLGLRHWLARLLRDRSGVALVEFAYCLPILMVTAMYGLELANYGIVRQQVSQLALQVADNASRMGAQEVLRNKPISEAEINDLLLGAQIQGESLDIVNRGRIILSSLELNSDDGQWLHWQRCRGAMTYPSSYGSQGDGTSGTAFPGMGPTDGRILAMENNPVMFVEIGYTYQPLISSAWAPPGAINEIAALIVRDDRDTTQVYNADADPVASC